MDQVPRGAGARPYYPWHQWADGSRWTLVWGEDYFVTHKAFQSAVYAHAKAHGLIATTHLIDDGMVIQFVRRARH